MSRPGGLVAVNSAPTEISRNIDSVWAVEKKKLTGLNIKKTMARRQTGSS